MRELLTGHETALSNREIIDLYNRAKVFFSTSEGDKALREIEVLQAVLHGQAGGYADKQCTYTSDDYLTHPERFTVTGFGPAFLIATERRLFSTSEPFVHWNELEKRMKTIIPNLEAMFHKSQEEFEPETGFVASIKDEPNLHFFRPQYNWLISDRARSALLQSGWLPIIWGVKAFAITTDDERIEAPTGFFAYYDFLNDLRGKGTLKDTEWEISSYKLLLPSQLEQTE